MHQRPLQTGKKYFLKHATQTVQAIVTRLESRINMTTLDPEPDPAALAINDIGGIRIKTAKPLVFDGYTTNRLTGSFILIEQGTNATVAAGMLSAAHRSRHARIRRLRHLKFEKLTARAFGRMLAWIYEALLLEFDFTAQTQARGLGAGSAAALHHCGFLDFAARHPQYRGKAAFPAT